jgi:CRP-like cAMP-binding protein
MSTLRPSRSAPPPLPEADGPLDHALTLLLADDPEAALRWGAASLERTPSSASAVIVTARLLERMGRLRAAIDGLRLAARQAIEEQNLPLAVVAIEDLRHLGADVASEVDEVAGAFCSESPRLDAGAAPMPFASLGDFQPLSPFLSGPALASRATQILGVSKYTHEELAGASPFAPVPLFSALSKAALRDLLSAFHMMTVPAGHRVVEEGQTVDAAYVVARGELEISRRAHDAKYEGLATPLGRVSSAPRRDGKPPIILSRIGRGAFFGEMATVSRLAAPSTVTATRPSILLVAKREALEAVAVQHPEVAAELARHCRHHMVSNLGWTSPVIAAMPPVERAALVDRLEMRFFRRGEKLVERGDEAKGLHLIVSGEVGVIGRDGREGVALG